MGPTDGTARGDGLGLGPRASNLGPWTSIVGPRTSGHGSDVASRRSEEGRRSDRMETPGWFLDEVARAGEEHLDPGYVAGYDAKAGFDPTDEVALLQGLGLGEASTLVDLGAGTGTLALAAAPFCRRVVAVDVSPVMVARLREQADRRGLGNMACVRGGFLGYEHRGDPADVVWSRNALHHLPDFWKAIALAGIAAMVGREACRGCSTWSAGSSRWGRGRSSRPGSATRRRTPNGGGRGPSWRRTCGRSAARSAGCSHRCWSGRASPSGTRPTTRGGLRGVSVRHGGVRAATARGVGPRRGGRPPRRAGRQRPLRWGAAASFAAEGGDPAPCWGHPSCAPRSWTMRGPSLGNRSPCRAGEAR